MIRMMVIIMVAVMTTTPAMMANYPVGMTHRITEDVECCAAEARRVDTRHRIRTPESGTLGLGWALQPQVRPRTETVQIPTTESLNCNKTNRPGALQLRLFSSSSKGSTRGDRATLLELSRPSLRIETLLYRGLSN